MPTPADDIIALYEHHAGEWDADRHQSRPEGETVWIRRFTEAALPEASILDLGCGSGWPIVPELLAAGLSVTGVDSSPSLISLCRQRFPEQTWVVGDMRRLDIDHRFAGIIAWHSLFHLVPEDQAQMFTVFAHHLRPSAPLMFTSGSERDETIGCWRNEPLYHASLSLDDYETLLATNGFVILDRVVGDITCGGATIWLAKAAD
ncbi:class I SAM-dependent methyltransferase [Asticcacaulis sp. SL142]|jgi:2-polyprenyl-3-methyl-5-hydroxy-6-metoxy-1,4-benzoquinol methylase|uniref:class I SAM-dependent DNA methyltransferase n=1 Tax=Asticcacaulis sp. SL142 TaxID=2995155 RepID=UPI00226CFB2E|nr:class I SAM-dependent methyltransferase [Asticcacaulis sp. SL142]WAC46799.1 class I SAM-dependent methyltransferase [Asticcacaulis sp. SL142]